MSRFTRAVPFSIEPRRRSYLSSPTRNRTRNFWLEARDDFRFTIEPICKQAEGEGVEPSRQVGPAPPGSSRLPSPIGLPIQLSSPTRIRTWNLSFEARHDVRFTIEPFCKQAEGKGFEPSSPLWWHALAVRPGKPYPATFRKIEWTERESNPPTDLARISRPLGTCQPISLRGPSGN